MNDDQQATTTMVSTEDTDPVRAAVIAAQMAIIDQAVRTSRDNGWCGEFERAMRIIFPDGPPDGSTEFVDSDGLSCRGYDREGYNRDGLDRRGYDREGYNRDGYNRDGYDREGYNRYGRDRDGYDREGFNADGWNRDGYNRDGLHRDSPEYAAVVAASYRFDRFGYDREGFNSRGQTRNGLSREDAQAHADVIYRYAVNDNGYRLDVNGVDPDGYDRQGNYGGRPEDAQYFRTSY